MTTSFKRFQRCGVARARAAAQQATRRHRHHQPDPGRPLARPDRRSDHRRCDPRSHRPHRSPSQTARRLAAQEGGRHSRGLTALRAYAKRTVTSARHPGRLQSERPAEIIGIRKQGASNIARAPAGNVGNRANRSSLTLREVGWPERALDAGEVANGSSTFSAVAERGSRKFTRIKPPKAGQPSVNQPRKSRL